MDSNDFLLGGTRGANAVPPELQRAIASSLRDRDSMGAIMALSGDRAVAPVGQQYMQSAQAQRQQVITHRYYQGMLEQQQAALKQQGREADQDYNLGMSKVGALERISARGKEYALANKDRVGLSSGVSALDTITQLASSYDPKWASSAPGSGSLRMTLARKAPMFAPQEMKDYQAWRSQLSRELEAVKQHELYGSALTVTEVKQWLDQTLDPDASPEQTAKFFQRLYPKLEKQIRLNYESARVRSPRQADAATGNRWQEVAPEEQAVDPYGDKGYYIEGAQ